MKARLISGISLTVIFILFAALQYNDPDWYVWIPIYLSAAVMSYLYSRSKLPQMAYLIVFAVTLISAIILWPEQHDDLTHAGAIGVEEGRESLGLGIYAATAVIFWISNLFKRTNKAS